MRDLRYEKINDIGRICGTNEWMYHWNNQGTTEQPKWHKAEKVTFNKDLGTFPKFTKFKSDQRWDD